MNLKALRLLPLRGLCLFGFGKSQCKADEVQNEEPSDKKLQSVEVNNEDVKRPVAKATSEPIKKAIRNVAHFKARNVQETQPPQQLPKIKDLCAKEEESEDDKTKRYVYLGIVAYLITVFYFYKNKGDLPMDKFLNTVGVYTDGGLLIGLMYMRVQALMHSTDPEMAELHLPPKDDYDDVIQPANTSGATE